MNYQKRHASVFIAAHLALLLPVCQLQAQNKEGKSTTMSTVTVSTLMKQSTKTVRVHTHTHDVKLGGHSEEPSAFWRFVGENRLAIQIVAGVVLVGAIGLFVVIRRGGKPPASK
jgi:hypothetical protein